MRLPNRDASDLDWLIFEQAGVLTWRQAVERLSEGRVRHLVATRRWRKICRGILLTHTGDLTLDQQSWIATLVAGPGAVLAGLTAAAEGGLKGCQREPLYVLIPATRIAPDLRRRLPLGMPGVVVKRTAVLPSHHVRIGRPPRTTMARSVVDAAQWASGEDGARVAIAAACQQRLVQPEELLTVLDELPRARRRQLILHTARDVAGGAQALGEIDLVRLCRRFGLPQPELQEKRRDASGRTRYLDAYWRTWHLHVEVDGAHHMDVRHWEQDMRRQNEVWIAGDRILRFPSWLVRRQPEEVARQIGDALRAAGWAGPTHARS